MNTDKLTIAALLILVIALSYRLYKLSSKSPEQPPKRDDPLDLAGFEERQNRFSREIEIEERLGKK